jgi:nucleotide-binding universal stress UspA family protein
MQLLVYFDSVQQRAAQRTIALLAEKFVFDVDLLVHFSLPNLDAWKEMIRGKVTVSKADGPFDQAVTRACIAKRYDLVVAAPNDRRGLVRMLLGSRIGRLVGSAPATIWVPRGEAVRLKRIVVGVSGGPQSEHDARLAARLAIAYDARLELVYVVSQLPLFFTTYDEFPSGLEHDDRLASIAPGVAELRRIYALLKSEGVNVAMSVRPGTVAGELVEACHGYGKHPPADLLVIGAHAPSGLGTTDYLDNLAEEITESAPCSTLVVHTQSALSQWQSGQQDIDGRGMH